jgi:hypothetical protein
MDRECFEYKDLLEERNSLTGAKVRNFREVLDLGT